MGRVASWPSSYCFDWYPESSVVDVTPQLVTCVCVPLQLGFFQIVGIPLFKSMADLFPDAQPMLDGVLTNFRHWELGTPMEDLPP